MKKCLLTGLALFCATVFNAQINLGTGSTTGGTAPISTYFGYSYVQQVFPKQEINASAAGNITGLKFYLPASASISNSNAWTVYLGHSNKTAFTSDTDWVASSNLTQVYSGTVTNNNGVVEITFATPFAYNNTDNLIVAATELQPNYDDNSYSDAFYTYTSTNGSSITYRDDYNPPVVATPPTGSLKNYKSVVTFMGLMPNSVPACPTVTYPANNATFVPLQPTINWNTISGATSYKVTVGTTPTGTNILNGVTANSNSYTFTSNLTPNTDYYVTVSSVGAGGTSTGCLTTKFTTQPPAPLNDDCNSAITLTVNPDLSCGTVTSGHTLGATASTDPTTPCYGTADDDVWFKFVATQARHRISLSNIQSIGTESSTDTYFQVLSGACGTLTSILCSDPDSAIAENLTPGQTYYVRVYSYYGTGYNQSFDICIGTFPPPPANDACSGALLASTFPYNYTQNDAAAATNNNGFIDCNGSGMNDGTWFTFVGDGSTVDITVTLPTSPNFDPEIGVYSGTCGNLNCVTNVDAGGSGTSETASIQTTNGTVYYVNVGQYSGYSDNPEDNFTINMVKTNLSTSETTLQNNKIKAYPNPFKDQLSLTSVKDVNSITITNVSGKLISIIEGNKVSETIPVHNLKAGMYIVTLKMKDGSVQTIKTIKN